MNATLASSSAWVPGLAVLGIATLQVAVTCWPGATLGIVVAEVAGSPSELASEVQRLARWPAVVIAVLNSATPLDASIRPKARNLPLAQSFGPKSAMEPATWADVGICESSDAADLSRRAARCPIPVIARRPSAWRDDLVQARAEAAKQLPPEKLGDIQFYLDTARAMAQELAPGRTSTVSALMMGAAWGIGALAPPLLDNLVPALGFRNVLAIMSAVTMLTVLFAYLLPAERHRVQVVPSELAPAAGD